MPEPRRARHDLVWLTPDGARRARVATSCGEAASAASRQLIEWVACARPLVMARQENVAPGAVRLGLPLPPSQGKRRLAFDVPAAGISASAPPPMLEAVVETLPAAWRTGLRPLLASSEVMRARPLVYGSAAMARHTGLRYLTERSDLDLVLTPPDWPGAQAAIRALAALDARNAAPRIDGEIVDASGRAVSWRELAGNSRLVLAKRLCGVALIERSRFKAEFGLRAGSRIAA